jgi:hypothetical protein
MSMNTFATAKQFNFIDSLVAQLGTIGGLSEAQQVTLRRVENHDGGVDKWDASALINGLLALKGAQPKQEAKSADPGYYVTANGTFLVVVKNRNGDRTYAKRLVVTKSNGRTKARWQYAPGMGQAVAEMTPMTLAQAAQFGHLHGVCLVCCRQLTDPESVQRGIGPVCATKVGR